MKSCDESQPIGRRARFANPERVLRRLDPHFESGVFDRYQVDRITEWVRGERPAITLKVQRAIEGFGCLMTLAGLSCLFAIGSLFTSDRDLSAILVGITQVGLLVLGITALVFIPIILLTQVRQRLVPFSLYFDGGLLAIAILPVRKTATIRDWWPVVVWMDEATLEATPLRSYWPGRSKVKLTLGGWQTYTFTGPGDQVQALVTALRECNQDAQKSEQSTT